MSAAVTALPPQTGSASQADRRIYMSTCSSRCYKSAAEGCAPALVEVAGAVRDEGCPRDLHPRRAVPAHPQPAVLIVRHLAHVGFGRIEVSEMGPRISSGIVWTSAWLNGRAHARGASRWKWTGRGRAPWKQSRPRPRGTRASRTRPGGRPGSRCRAATPGPRSPPRPAVPPVAVGVRHLAATLCAAITVARAGGTSPSSSLARNCSKSHLQCVTHDLVCPHECVCLSRPGGRWSHRDSETTQARSPRKRYISGPPTRA
jgi:hypothetical protein